jgi:adenylate cyclase
LFLQLSEGRLMEGMEQAKLALASDPLSGYAHAVYAMTCVFAGKTTEGVVVGRRAVELDSDCFVAHWVLQVAMWLSGRFEESVAIASAAAREDEAIRHAFEAYEIRDPNCQNFFSRFFHFVARLYGYARFREIIVKMGRSEWLCDPLPPRAMPGATYAGITS